MAAIVELESGHAVIAMGTAAEVDAALADSAVYDEHGWALLRFALEPALFRVDPRVVVGVYECTDCETR